ncbi:leucyl/phenylalanyl-tRNA--protein transferase [bacterium]|nr:MAG: leucyl/phenylalanyl-tRNA--protein transferase [bacterium]
MSKTRKPKPIPADELLSAYAQGIFPMADDANAKEVMWYTAIKRGVIPMDDFKVSKNVLQRIKKQDFEVRIDSDFEAVMRACANRDSTWISEKLVSSYVNLHEYGFAHCVEIWRKDELIGGLYGVKLRRAFFGESMFKREKEMDKVALYYCHQWLKKEGVILWDTQFWTSHLAQFGCIEIEAETYQRLLEEALSDL